MMMPGRFKSREANSQFSEQPIVKFNGRYPTIFVLAVQEANFFYSFTLSFFIALTTICDQMMDRRFESLSSKLLFVIALLQWVYGMFISIYLYGRKVPSDEDDDDDDDDYILENIMY